MDTSTLKSQIWQIVSLIPSGKVATYGQVAALAGYPNHARFVGATLKNLPRHSRLPWFRVINGKGKLAFPENSASYRRQRRLLENEGVAFIDHRIPLKHYQWRP